MNGSVPARTFRLTGAAFVCAGLGLRLWLSATAYGSNDVGYFSGFATTVRELGPVGIYHVPFDLQYNHPPLVGWILTVVNWLTDRGLSFPFALRLLPILADAASVVLVMYVARRRLGDRTALAGGALVAFSLVLVLVSGAHGNFDTVFCALVLLSLVLMVEKKWAFAAGAVAAIAVGVKLVPLVVIPVIALSGNRRALGRYAAGFLVLSSAIWVPALAQEFDGVVANVLGYRGIYGAWGWPHIATLLGAGRGILSSVRGVAGLAVSVSSMLLGVWWLRSRRRSPYAAAALAIAAFLFLTPAWGAQYLSWPVTLLFFMHAGFAVSYSVAAGAFLFVLYVTWSDGFPLDRIDASVHLGPLETALGLLTWVVLGLGVAYAIARAGSAEPELVHDHSPETADHARSETVGLETSEQPLRGRDGGVPRHVEEMP